MVNELAVDHRNAVSKPAEHEYGVRRERREDSLRVPIREPRNPVVRIPVMDDQRRRQDRDRDHDCSKGARLRRRKAVLPFLVVRLRCDPPGSRIAELCRTERGKHRNHDQRIDQEASGNQAGVEARHVFDPCEEDDRKDVQYADGGKERRGGAAAAAVDAEGTDDRDEDRAQADITGEDPDI